MIYLDYQASTPVDEEVVAAMEPFLSHHCGNPHSGDHAAGWHANTAVQEATGGLSQAINADPDEIIFTSGATEANNLAVLGLARRAPKSKKRMLVSAIEHKSVLEAAAAASRLGLEVERIPVDPQGYLDLPALESSLGEDVLLVSVLAVSNEIGTIQSVAEVARLSHSVGAVFHVDGSQALAAMPLDVEELQVDLLSLSGHKIYGPKGVGVLYARRGVQGLLEPLFYGGGQQGGLRAGTLPVPLCVGLQAAVRRISGSQAVAERARIGELRDSFLRSLRDRCPAIKTNGPPSEGRHPGNANVQFEGYDARDILAAAQPLLAASSGSACDSGTEEPSYVLRAIGLSRDQARSSIRFSLGRFTTPHEVAAAVEVVGRALESLSSGISS